MGTMNIFHALLFLVVIGVMKAEKNSVSEIPSNMKLELVQVVFRHGERTCLKKEYVLYPYLETSVYEPFGVGQLTNTGLEQMYNVGRMLRKRYDGYLKEQYLSQEVYAYSSEDDRTKSSLQLVLAGLYPPSPRFIWNEKLLWIPIPFRYTPKQMDVLMKSYLSKKFLKLLKEVYKTPSFTNSMSKFWPTFDLINRAIDRNITFNDPDYMAGLYNIFHIHKSMGYALPLWYTDQVKHNLTQIMALINFAAGQTLLQKKLNGGPMIRKTLQNMNLEGSLKNPRKIYLYSGHDMTLNGILRTLDIQELPILDFGSTLIFEKYSDAQNQVFVRLLAYSPVDKTTIALRFGNCAEFCPINKYKEHIRDILPNDEEMTTLFNEYNFENFKDLLFGDDLVPNQKGI